MSLSEFDIYRIIGMLGCNSENEEMILMLGRSSVNEAIRTWNSMDESKRLEQIRKAESTIEELKDLMNRAKIELMSVNGGSNAIH